QTKQAEQLGEYDQVREELRAQYPELKNIIITHGKNMSVNDTATSADTVIVYLEARKAISRTTQARIRNWLKTRFKLEHVYVVGKVV
ncbi:MAG: hypothetical protein Q8K43_00710, partial [Sulfurimicrobium sp.]|nr:hypothetical protein [Sulfurimicrobium sp.]